MIPRVIHYVWVGGPLPDLQRSYIQTWRDTNPDYQFIQWNESNLDFSIPLLRQAYTERKWAKVADIARLLAILRHGGMYLDTDIKLVKPLDPLLERHCFFGFQTELPSRDWVANGVMGARQGHWFIARTLTALLGIRSLPGFERPTSFGPKLVTKLLISEGLDANPLHVHRYYQGAQVKDIYICPTRYFFPYPFGAEFEPGCVTPETYGIHFWERSWEKDVPRWVRIAKGARDRARSVQARLTRGTP